ncbi:MAG: short-chain dehydrogenase [Roseateles depolymerans]|uniref:Short-chain dehydrogenase n=1 Tax=Roseateles depolymerans TaxID=76731 RepID=A0A2W5DHT2_9BURK|nr:MAG: short-chain dehydrogenase [Roseateles depolymerans]
MKLSGNTIFITGGTSGIGLGLALALQQRGNQVIVAGRRRERLAQISAQHPGIATVELDVTRPESIQAAARDVLARFPALNVVINNAGVMPFDSAGSGALDDAGAVHLLETNVLGPVRVSAAFIEHLKRQPEAYLINNSSILAFLPLASNALYSATKAAIHSYTLSQRFLLRKTSVKVLEIAPPWVDTDLIHKSGDPRAMPLDDFIAQTVERLGSDDIEVLVDSVKAIRDNPGSGEHALIDQFNEVMEREPIPVA